MDKEITITITDREAYYLAQAVAWKRGTRQLFGVTKLGDKIYDQMVKSVPAQRIVGLNQEWSDAKDKAPKEAEAHNLQTQKTICTKHWIPLPCALCKAQPHGKKFMKNIETPAMQRQRLDVRAEKSRDKLLEKAAEKNKTLEETI